MYRADVHRITELTRQLEELRADAADLERRADALDRELRQLRVGGNDAARRAALGLALGFGPFLVMGIVLLTMGRDVLAGDAAGVLECAAPMADAVRAAALPLDDAEQDPASAVGIPHTPDAWDAAGDDHGYLTVFCDPACDEVLDAGRSLGPSPVVHQPIAPGEHRLVLHRAGASRFGKVSVVPGVVTSRSFSMK